MTWSQLPLVYQLPVAFTGVGSKVDQVTLCKPVSDSMGVMSFPGDLFLPFEQIGQQHLSVF